MVGWGISVCPYFCTSVISYIRQTHFKTVQYVLLRVYITFVHYENELIYTKNMFSRNCFNILNAESYSVPLTDLYETWHGQIEQGTYPSKLINIHTFRDISILLHNIFRRRVALFWIPLHASGVKTLKTHHIYSKTPNVMLCIHVLLVAIKII